MKIHNYHSVTRAYLGSSDADMDELESKAQGVDVWMLPALATFIEPPPAPEGMVPVFSEEDQSWELVLASAAAMNTGEEPPAFEQQRAYAIQLVDAEVDAIIWAVVGNRAQEYLTAEQEARAYLESLLGNDSTTDEPAPVPPYVMADVNAHNRTPEEAAQAILGHAATWRAASLEMRTLRLFYKVQMGKTATAEDLAAVQQRWATMIGAVRLQLAL